MARVQLVCMFFFVAVSNRITISTEGPLVKSDEIQDQAPVISLDAIKSKLAETGVFDWNDATLTETEKKELGKLFDAVEIMTTSRNRQPSSAQNIYGTLRTVERVVRKQLKEGQISESLAARFKWQNILKRSKRNKLPFIKKNLSTQNSLPFLQKCITIGPTPSPMGH